jgi:flagellar hook-length control protein FliK
MSNSALSNLSDIVVAGTNVGGVGSNSSDRKKASESENKEFGPCEFGAPNPDTEEISAVKQQDIAGASGPEEAKSTRSRFREVLERRLGEESNTKSNCEGEDNTQGAHQRMELGGDAARLLNVVKAGEKGGVKTIAKCIVSVGDLVAAKQKRATVEGESGEKAGQLHKVDAGYVKVVEGNTAEAVPLTAKEQLGPENQEKAKAGQDKMAVENAGVKESGLEAKVRVARGAGEVHTNVEKVNTEGKIVSDDEQPARRMFRQQVSEEGKVLEGNKGAESEPLKIQAEHTVRVRNEGQGQNETVPPAALRAELKLRTAREDIAKGEPDALQNQQRFVNGTDVTEASYFRAQVNNVAGVNGLNQNDDVAGGINSIATRSQPMSNSVEATSGIKSVAEQIIGDIGANLRGVDQEIRIMLNPPDLGRVRIQFQQRGEEIIGWLQVEKAQTRYAVERELPQIVASLQQNGIPVRRVNVTQNSYNEPGEHKNNTSEDYHGTGQGELGEQSFNGGSQDNEEQTRATRQILTNGEQSNGSTALYEVGDDSINVYV